MKLNKNFSGGNKLFLIIALVLLLTVGPIAVGIPIANAQANTTLAWSISHEIIGVNQPLLMSVVVSSRSFASVYGVEWTQNIVTQEFVWPDAYVVFTKPDGTTDTVQGPFELGVAHRPRFFYTPDMVGTWTATFVWPGDQYYNPANTTRTFEVQQQPIPKRDVWAILATRPDTTIGVNQWLLINAWVTPPPLTGSEVFWDYLFTITQPDGSSFEIGPMWSEGPGTVWFDFPVDQVGQWTIEFDFPGDVHNNPASVTKTITVQQDPVPIGYPDTPLPTQEWTFPINVNNREWRNIAGPWMQSHYNASQGAFNPYTEAPRTAHVLWKADPRNGIGGFVGSPHSIETGSGESVYGAGDAGIYSSTNVNIRTVMAGRGYYTGEGMIHCVDMRTGEKLWEVDGNFDVGATRGRDPVLYSFGSRFIVYDALTGAMTLNVTGLSMTYFTEPYVISTSSGNLIKWDTGTATTNFTDRIVWNVTNPLPTTSGSHSLIHNNLIISRRFPQQTVLTDALIAVNLTTGALEYNTTTMDWTQPDTWIYRQGPAIGSGYGKVYFAAIPHENEGYGYVAFDAATGEQVWTSEKTEYPWGEFWAYMPQASAYNMNFGLSYDGVYAFNITNGEIIWHYTAEDPYNETPYNQYVFGSTGPVVGGGVVFAPNTEHSPTFYYRGQRLHAIDAFTGDQVWTMLGTYVPTAIAYGILLAQETPSGFTYAFGKGVTETTVSVNPAMNSGVLIEGTVIDQSPAQNGTVAIADEYMTQWMEHLHMQQPMPDNATGVEVTLDAIYPDGEFVPIGRVTSNMEGKYGMMWTPPAEGTYQIIATFEGSESYYSSYSTTYLAVGPAQTGDSPQPTTTPSPTSPATDSPQPTTTPITSPTPVPQPGSDQSLTMYIAIAAAVIIAAVIGAAVLLKRRTK